MSDLPDLIYVVKRGDTNETLRYSLRSVAALLPHRRVFIAGYRPSFIDPASVVTVDTGNGRRTRYENSTANLTAALNHPDCGPNVVYMNDDFYLTQPVTKVAPLHRGPADEWVRWLRGHRGGRVYARGAAETLRLVRRYVDSPLCYEAHVPMPMPRDRALTALDIGARDGITALHKRTLIGNVCLLGGDNIGFDPKITARNWPDPLPEPYVSTDYPGWYGDAGDMLRAMFPSPCKYERPQDSP